MRISDGFVKSPMEVLLNEEMVRCRLSQVHLAICCIELSRENRSDADIGLFAKPSMLEKTTPHVRWLHRHAESMPSIHVLPEGPWSI